MEQDQDAGIQVKISGGEDREQQPKRVETEAEQGRRE
jgi:hypothetical protein